MAMSRWDSRDAGLRHRPPCLGRVDIDVPTLDDTVVLTGRMKQFGVHIRNNARAVRVNDPRASNIRVSPRP